MKSKAFYMTEAKIESIDNRIEIIRELKQEEEERKAQAKSEFMKDHHSKYIMRYEAIIETLQDSRKDIQHIQEMLEA